jgi:hypothetical protein
VIWRAGRLDFGALQDRLRSGPARARQLALELPAAYVVFDLLALNTPTYATRPTSGAAARWRSCSTTDCRPVWYPPRPAPTRTSPAHGCAASVWCTAELV